MTSLNDMTNKAHSNNRNARKKHGKIFFAFL